jgi:tetratricopeptide (TPR) repeat protein
MAVSPLWGAMHSDEKTLKRIEELERRLRSKPEDRDALREVVRLSLEAGRASQAADLLESLLKQGDGSWEVLRDCADAHRVAGDPRRGLALLDDKGTEHNDRASYWSLRGRMHEDLESFEQARKDHERALALDAQDPEIRYRLGVALMKAGLEEQAILAFEHCVRTDPRMSKAQINIGYIYDQQGEREKAILAFQRALEMNPDSVESHCNLGAAYGDLGRKREAIEEFKKAIELDPLCSLAHFNLGVIYLEDRPEEARSSLQKALAIDPQNIDIQYYLGVLFFKKGMYDTSLRYLEQCRQQQPDAARVLYVLGMAYNKSDMPDHAIEVLIRLCDLEPQNADAHYNLGIALDKKGLYDQAKAAYRQADRLMQQQR